MFTNAVFSKNIKKMYYFILSEDEILFLLAEIEVKEGDILKVVIDIEETTERRKRIEGMMKNLWAD